MKITHESHRAKELKTKELGSGDIFIHNIDNQPHIVSNKRDDWCIINLETGKFYAYQESYMDICKYIQDWFTPVQSVKLVTSH